MFDTLNEQELAGVSGGSVGSWTWNQLKKGPNPLWWPLRVTNYEYQSGMMHLGPNGNVA